MGGESHIKCGCERGRGAGRQSGREDWEGEGMVKVMGGRREGGERGHRRDHNSLSLL